MNYNWSWIKMPEIRAKTFKSMVGLQVTPSK